MGHDHVALPNALAPARPERRGRGHGLAGQRQHLDRLELDAVTRGQRQLFAQALVLHPLVTQARVLHLELGQALVEPLILAPRRRGAVGRQHQAVERREHERADATQGFLGQPLTGHQHHRSISL